MQAAQQALCGAGAIESAISNLNDGLGRQWDCKMKIAVSVHAGRAAVGEIGSSDPPTMLAIGEAMDVAHEIRKAATAHDMPFAVSEQVFTAAGLVPTFEEKITLPSPGCVSVAVCLSTSGAALAPATLAASHSAVPNLLRKLRA